MTYVLRPEQRLTATAPPPIARAMALDLLDELPAAQRLALAYATATTRRPTLALLALDARLGAVLRRRGEPVLAQMRFAWWRDRLGSDPAAWPRGDAVLALLGEWRDPAALIPLIDGWEVLVGEVLDSAAIDAFADGRGEAFAALAREVEAPPAAAQTCGRTWGLADLAANLANPAERASVLAAAAALPPCPKLPRALRPLAVLGGLAQRALQRGGTPLLDGPAAALLAVRLGIVGR